MSHELTADEAVLLTDIKKNITSLKKDERFIYRVGETMNHYSTALDRALMKMAKQCEELGMVLLTQNKITDHMGNEANSFEYIAIGK